MTTRPDEALEAMLAAWRVSFDPTLGRLIERLGESLSVPLEDLPLKKGELADALAKLAVKAPAAQRSAVLQAFEQFAREAAGRLVWPSVEAWAEADLDPRVARMALRVLSQSKQQLTAKLWRRLVNCVERHADAGVVEDARAYEALLVSKGGGWGFSPERFTNALKKALKQREGAPPEDAAALQRLAQAVGRNAPVASSAPGDDSAMLEAIAARPDDDGPRLVYADWLSERRKPLGEFIVLQVQRARGRVSKEARAREDALLARHRGEFLGPLEGQVAKTGLRFERGFPVAARFPGPAPVHPLTRLLRGAEFQAWEWTDGARFDELRVAVGPPGEACARLPAVAPRLVDWVLRLERLEPVLEVLQRVRLERLALRHLNVADVGATVRALFHSPALVGSVRTLELALIGAPVGGPALGEAPPTLEHLVLELARLHADFRRGADGWTLDLRTPSFYGGPSVTAALTTLLQAFQRAPLAALHVRLRGDAPQERANQRAAVEALGPIARRVTWHGPGPRA